MLLSLSWLKEFVPYTGTAEELADRLTMLGLEAEGILRPYEHLAPLVVGHVTECGTHPDADKLSVCRVDVGDEVLDIVCGAPNVAQGQKVVVIKVGATLPDGTVIKKAKLRGQPSHGMICSERELGLSDEHDGIMVLDENLTPGTPILEVLPLDREIIDISVTPNRGDCLSVLGLAREVALAYNLPLTLPASSLQEIATKASDAITVTVSDTERCPLYFGRVLENAATGRSPAWMRYRLSACGIRSISNLVDITNYVMLELGQPLHAFDLDCIAQKKIIVRPAVQDEKMVTLDDMERQLVEGDIVIADPEKGVGLGGVMGGLNSEITATTKQVFLEAAVFAPWQIRRTARRLGISSEASFRFERGVDQSATRFALDRAAALMADITGASVYSGVSGEEGKKAIVPSIGFSLEYAQNLVGVPFTEEFCLTTLQAIGCTIEKTSLPTTWTIQPPVARTDIACAADLVEELARVHGVDNIPTTLPRIFRDLENAGKPTPKHTFITDLKYWAAGKAGLFEAINYSFTAHKLLDLFGLPEEDRIYLQNPLSEELNVLRTELAPALIGAVGNSLTHGAGSVRLFEIGSTFHADASQETKAREIPHIGIALCGSQSEQPWSNLKGTMGYADCKGLVQALAAHVGIHSLEWRREEAGKGYLLPHIAILHEGTIIGHIGLIAPHIAEYFNCKREIWYAEVNVDYLYEQHLTHGVRFAPLAVYPPIRRDITFITPMNIPAAAIQSAIVGLNIAILEEVAFMDTYTPEGKEERNLTFRLTFRSQSRTLKETEADKQRDTVIQKLKEQLGVSV